jgi:hypothetical protein
MKKMRTVVHGMAVLIVLAGCSNGPRAVSEELLAKLRTIEVSIDVPPGNFLYVHGSSSDTMPPVMAPAGTSAGAVMAANIFAGLLIAGIEHAMTAAGREATVPIGNSVKDLDVRTMAFGHLKTMSAGVSNAPALTLSAEPFPKEQPVQVPQAEINAPPGSFPKPDPPDPLKPMRDRARVSQADASLFVRVWPVFRGGPNTATMVQSAAWLYDKSGNLIYNSATTFVGPASPNLARTEVVRWWADGRFRRHTVHGIRAVTLPLGEDLITPVVGARRTADMEHTLATKSERHRTDGMQLREAVPQAQESTANAMRMRSTGCAVESDDKNVIYRYERHVQGQFVAVSAYCPGERLDLWSQDMVPGMSWLTQPLPTPVVVTSAPN